MMNKFLLVILLMASSSILSSAQTRVPSTPAKPYIVKTGQQLSDIYKDLGKQNGNKQFDVFPAPGTQMRVAVFHDENRVDDLFEVHDASDDVYYVLEGTASLMLGGALIAPNEISNGEWRSKSASGGTKVDIKKGDLIVVPRGTSHQRTVTGKGFSMIIIKVFAENVKP